MNLVDHKLTENVSFTMELRVIAPADSITSKPNQKYEALRNILLEALNTKAWGIRLNVKADSKEELARHIKYLRNAGSNWKYSVQLCRRYGLDLATYSKVSEDGLSAIVDMAFKPCEP